MRSSRFLLFAGILGATGVALGAFGAHALKEKLAASAMTPVWEKAVHYQLFHALAVLGCALALESGALRPIERWLARGAWCWTVGVILFSGSLYPLALGGPRILGAITPFGGVAMIAGWIFIACAAGAKSNGESSPAKNSRT